MDTAAITSVVTLDDPAAGRPDLVGAKAANLARARAAGLPTLPGVVLTTAWSSRDLDDALRAWRSVSDGGTQPVVVRSSSTGEDGEASSMAGVFDSILDVADEAALVAAVDAVLASGERARRDGVVDAGMAVLVQPMLHPAWGGVLFGADPVTGRHDHLVVAAVPGGPDQLVSGAVDGWTGVLDRRGRVQEVRAGGVAAPQPPKDVLRRLARLAADTNRAFGGPQDVEWAVDDAGHLHLLQARPITTLPPTEGTVFGPGPVAESFPAPLSTLEQDLWLAPLRQGLREALTLTGTSPAAALRRSPLVVAVDGLAAADLAALGVEERKGGFLTRLDPRPPARRLRAAWRVGRLEAALPTLATDLVDRIDADLLAVPALDELGHRELLAVLGNGSRWLVSLHGHEALAGLLIPAAASATVTGATMALAALAEVQGEGVSFEQLAEDQPVVLALVPPRIGPSPALEDLGTGVAAPALPDEVDPAALVREALRLRIRWVQELMARAAWELGRRLADVGMLPTQVAVRHAHLEQLETAVRHRTPITVDVDVDVDTDTGTGSTTLASPGRRALPARFRLDGDGRAWAVPPARSRRRDRRRTGADDHAVGAGGGRASGPVLVGGFGDDIPAGAVLVVTHLDPRLAPVVGRLAGLVAETGSPLSHLAILAREAGVATVVGLADATTRFTTGAVVEVDGHAGKVTAMEAATNPTTSTTADGPQPPASSIGAAA